MDRKNIIGDNNPNKILVVHLARLADGLQAFQSFVSSYRKHPAGAPHDLLIAFKGFVNKPETLELWKANLVDIDYSMMCLEDMDFDIGSYCRVAERYPERAILVLNSNSVLLVDKWLKLLLSYANGNTLVGATGSWENSKLLYLLTSRYVGMLSDINMVRWFARLLCATVRWQNPHLRTNAILFPPAFFPSITLPRKICDKSQAYSCESGFKGISRQARKRGFKLLVVDRNGAAYSWKDWPKSHTFRIGEQEGLIVGDKQTHMYAEAPSSVRDMLSKYAWGLEYEKYSKPPGPKKT
jgi:hypothetical protein